MLYNMTWFLHKILGLHTLIRLSSGKIKYIVSSPSHSTEHTDQVYGKGKMSTSFETRSVLLL